MSIASDARFWDRGSRKYAKAAIADQDGYARTLDRTRSLLGASDRVLELGCGTGTTAFRLSGDVKSYLATDFSAGMIAIAEERRIAAPVPALKFRTATAEALELETGQFNAIIGFNYLHLVRVMVGCSVAKGLVACSASTAARLPSRCAPIVRFFGYNDVGDATATIGRQIPRATPVISRSRYFRAIQAIQTAPQLNPRGSMSVDPRSRVARKTEGDSMVGVKRVVMFLRCPSEFV